MPSALPVAGGGSAGDKQPSSRQPSCPAPRTPPEVDIFVVLDDKDGREPALVPMRTRTAEDEREEEHNPLEMEAAGDSKADDDDKDDALLEPKDDDHVLRQGSQGNDDYSIEDDDHGDEVRDKRHPGADEHEAEEQLPPPCRPTKRPKTSSGEEEEEQQQQPLPRAALTTEPSPAARRWPSPFGPGGAGASEEPEEGEDEAQDDDDEEEEDEDEDDDEAEADAEADAATATEATAATAAEAAAAAAAAELDEAGSARLVEALTRAAYDVSVPDLAAALDVSTLAVRGALQRPDMQAHYAAWRRARRGGRRGPGAWNPQKRATMVQTLTRLNYNITARELADVLGVSADMVYKRMREPGLEQHLAAWTEFRERAAAQVVWSEERRAQLVDLLAACDYAATLSYLAAALGVSTKHVRQELQRPGMEHHYAAWRKARESVRDQAHEQRRARLVELLTSCGYTASARELAAALGVSENSVRTTMCHPDMKRHKAAWHKARTAGAAAAPPGAAAAAAPPPPPAPPPLLSPPGFPSSAARCPKAEAASTLQASPGEWHEARLVEMLTTFDYAVDVHDVAAALGVDKSTVYKTLRRPGMERHHEAWCKARPGASDIRSAGRTARAVAPGSDGVERKARPLGAERKARLLAMLRKHNYNITAMELARRLGMAQATVYAVLREPDMAQHFARYRAAMRKRKGAANASDDPIVASPWTEEHTAQLVKLLTSSGYDVGTPELAKLLRVQESAVKQAMRRPDMEDHLAAWRQRRSVHAAAALNTVTKGKAKAKTTAAAAPALAPAWSEERRAQLVEVLTNSAYSLGPRELATALGVDERALNAEMRQPDMAHHNATWKAARNREATTTAVPAPEPVPASTSAAKLDTDGLRIVAALRERGYNVSARALCQALGMGREELMRRLRGADLQEHYSAWVRQRHSAMMVWSPERRAELVRLLRRGQHKMSSEELGAALGVSAAAVAEEMQRPAMKEHYSAWLAARFGCLPSRRTSARLATPG
eukprot:scaffold1127_cov361-Prasinococcus_capsulatus_cf.AAC.7